MCPCPSCNHTYNNTERIMHVSAPATMATPNGVVADAASGAPSAAPGALTDIQRAIQTRLQEVKLKHIRWHIIVNNHAFAY